MAVTSTTKLASLLEGVGLFAPAQVEEILSRQQQGGKSLTEVVVGEGLAKEDVFLEKLAGVMGIPFVRVGEAFFVSVPEAV